MLSNDAGHSLSESHQLHLHLHPHHRTTPNQVSSADQSLVLDQQAPICSSNLNSPQQQQQQPQQSNSQNCLFVKSESPPGRRYRPQKYCAVCGDRAIACNFNAVTCESCKAFFRRNAFKEQRLKCLFNNRCVINRVTRRFCSKCRILKCFQIGMKREWILTDEQKQLKRVKIMQNKQLKKHSVSSVASYGSPRNINGIVGGTHGDALDTDALHLERLDCNRRMSGSIGSRSDTSTETLATIRSSSSTNGQVHVEMKDAQTSCPDEFELAAMNGGDSKLIHYCSLVPQCQFCFSKLSSSHCNIDEQPNIQQQQQSSTTSNSLIAYYQSVNQTIGFSQTGAVNCDYNVACRPSRGSRNSLEDNLVTAHQSDHQNTSSRGEERVNSSCCYLEPVASSCLTQANQQFDQFVERSQLSSTTSDLASSIEQQNSQLIDPLQLSYIVPNCSAIVDSQHQTKVEFCPQRCPIQPCMCSKNN